MDNKTALFLAVTIVGVLVGDWYFYDGQLPVLVGKRFIQLTQFLAFWR